LQDSEEACEVGFSATSYAPIGVGDMKMAWFETLYFTFLWVWIFNTIAWE
jgi:hypothetical protein